MQDYIRTAEAAKLLSISRQQLHRYVKDKKIKTYKDPNNTYLTYFSKAEIEAFKAARENPILVPADELETPPAAEQHLKPAV